MPPRTPGPFRKRDAVAVLAGPSLPAPRILEGASTGELDEPIARQAAQLCRLAGADLEAIPAWAEIGRERRANAGRPPFCEPKLGGRAGTPDGPC